MPDLEKSSPARRPASLATNQAIADKLAEMADLLERQAEDGFHIRAYRRAADSVRACTRPLEDVLRRDGLAGLDALEGFGPRIARAIAEMLETGRWSQLERLHGALDPEELLQTLPGLGPRLAARIHETLHIDTLEALEMAAEDGRLAEIAGVGPRRAAQIRASLRDHFRNRRLRRTGQAQLPPVDVLLAIDAAYTNAATKGELPMIAPKRFNPSGEAWLPVMHGARAAWRYTALFSNTRLARDLGRTRDWVVIYAHRDDEPETQSTIVTETRGPLAGKRVVRGHEGDCIAHYAKAAP